MRIGRNTSTGNGRFMFRAQSSPCRSARRICDRFFYDKTLEGPRSILPLRLKHRGSENVFDMVFSGGRHKKGKIKRPSD